MGRRGKGQADRHPGGSRRHRRSAPTAAPTPVTRCRPTKASSSSTSSPRGILNPHCLSVVGAGVVVDPRLMLEEMDHLAARGVSLDRLRISERAHVVLPVPPDPRWAGGRASAAGRLDRHHTARQRSGLQRQGRPPRHCAWSTSSIRRRCAHASARSCRAGTASWQRSTAPAAWTLTRLYDELAGYGERLRPVRRPDEPIVADALDSGRAASSSSAPRAPCSTSTTARTRTSPPPRPPAAGACQGAGVPPTQRRSRARRLQGLFDPRRRGSAADRAARRDRRH